MLKKYGIFLLIHLSLEKYLIYRFMKVRYSNSKKQFKKFLFEFFLFENVLLFLVALLTEILMSSVLLKFSRSLSSQGCYWYFQYTSSLEFSTQSGHEWEGMFMSRRTKIKCDLFWFLLFSISFQCSYGQSLLCTEEVVSQDTGACPGEFVVTGPGQR